MKAFLYTLILIPLLLIGGAASYAIVYPKDARSYLRQTMGGKPAPAKKNTAASNPAAAKPAAAGATAPARKAPPPPPAAVAAANQAPAAAGAPAAGAKAAATPPPSRSNALPAGTAPLRRATLIESASAIPQGGEAPTPDAYPFRVDQRIFPNPNTVRVEMSVKNNSGKFWRTAYITLRSSGTDTPVSYRVDEWRTGETVGIDYTFPKSELNDRMKDLRVVRVTGVLRESALAERIEEEKRGTQIGRRNDDGASSTRADRRADAPDTVRVPGLLGLLASSSAERPVRISEVSPGAHPLKITLPAGANVPPQLIVPFPLNTDERKNAVDILQRANAKALNAQENLRRLVALLQSKSYDEAMDADGVALRREVSNGLKEFSALGINLSQVAANSKDQTVKSLPSQLQVVSTALLDQIVAVEEQVRAVDQEFKLQEDH